ncbi:MAG: hypothetical protein HDR49_03735 [Bacteroides sp.]|nr:hypothetical protein [Bacteroides sp.]
MYGQSINKQTVGSANIYIRGFELTFSNDAIGDKNDRWRTNAVELSYGNFSIGSSIFTNNGSKESDYIALSMDNNGNTVQQNRNPSNNKAPKLGINHNYFWENGQAFASPLWIGFRNHNQVYRMGYSHPKIQDKTQNLIHRKLTPTPQFLGYGSFYTGPFVQTSTINPFSIW